MWLLILALIPFAFSMTISPGPSNILVLMSSTTFGYRRTIPVILGLALGLAGMIFAVGLGLSQVFTAVPALHTILKTISIGYLLYLAWRIARSSQFSAETDQQKALSFVECLLLQLVNPKAWIVSISTVAAYSSDDNNLLLQTLTMFAVFAVAAIISLSTWAVFGTFIARLLQSPRSVRFFNITLAVVLVISLIPLLNFHA